MNGWVGFVDDAGHFSLDKRREFAEWVKKFAGHEVVLTVKKRQHGQGSQSMRYYRGVVIPDIAEACGYIDPDDFESVHDSLAWKFLRIDDHPEFGTPRRRSTSKGDMSQEELTAYIDKVILYAETSIPGCRVRRPNEAEEALAS